MKKLNDIRVGILKIPVTRIALLIISDLMAVLLSSVLSLYVRYEFRFMDVPREFWENALAAYLYNVVILLVVFNIFKLYKSVWRYASDRELVNIAVAVFLCALIQPVMLWLMGRRLPRSYPFFTAFS